MAGAISSASNLLATNLFPQKRTTPRPLSDLAFLHSVRVGELWLPPKALTERLSQHCFHIFCLNEHKTFPYSLRGSGSAIQINGRNFVFLFKHQIFPDYDPNKIVISPAGNKELLVTGSNYFFVEGTDASEDLTDFCALGYAVERYSIQKFERDFFKSTPEDTWPNNTRNFFMLYGYPYELQDICPEGKAIAGKMVHVTGTYAGRSNSRFLHRIEMLRNSCFNPDGMSGGLVFHLGEDHRGYFMGLAGFIVRGGKGSEMVHFIEARAAHMLADSIGSKPA